MAVERGLRRGFQMLDAFTPVGRWKRFLRHAGDYAFEMNEFAFEHMVMHWNPPWIATVIRPLRQWI